MNHALLHNQRDSWAFFSLQKKKILLSHKRTKLNAFVSMKTDILKRNKKKKKIFFIETGEVKIFFSHFTRKFFAHFLIPT